MNTWLKNFKPKMIMYVRPCMEDPTAIAVRAVCADRVFRVRYKMACKLVENSKNALKLLRGSGGR